MPRKKIGTGWFHCTHLPAPHYSNQRFHEASDPDPQRPDSRRPRSDDVRRRRPRRKLRSFCESTMDEVQDLRDRLNEKAAKWKQQQAVAAKRQQAVGSNVKDRLGPKACYDTSESDDKSNVRSQTVSDARGSRQLLPAPFPPSLSKPVSPLSKQASGT